MKTFILSVYTIVYITGASHFVRENVNLEKWGYN